MNLDVPEAVEKVLTARAAAYGEDVNTYAVAVLTAHTREDDAPRPSRFTPEQRAAANAALGKSRPHDPEATFRKFGLTYKKRTREEIAASAEKALAEMDPKVREELERGGWI